MRAVESIHVRQENAVGKKESRRKPRRILREAKKDDAQISLFSVPKFMTPFLCMYSFKKVNQRENNEYTTSSQRNYDSVSRRSGSVHLLTYRFVS